MRIVTLLENTVCRGDLACEHGLSLYIEACGKRILFDAGQSNCFAENARKMGIDLTRVDFAVLSHGHYDHGGGLAHFLRINPTAPVYLSRHAFTPHYNALGKDIGLDPALKESGRLRYVEEAIRIAEGITLYPGSQVAADGQTYGLRALVDGKLVADDFCHEQYMMIRQGEQTVCFSGCSHRGIVPIVREFHPDVLVGGFHFMKLEPDGACLQEAGKALLAQKTLYYTGHCTGQEQYAVLKRILGQRLHSLSTGCELVL